MNMKKLFTHGVTVAALLAIIAVPTLAATKDKKKANPLPISVNQLKQRPAQNKTSVAAGKKLYNRSCVYCHGTKGMGKGPVAYFLSRSTGPHPRDFTAAVYKFRSTQSGELPMDEDLFRTITNGVPGFMPGFAGLKVADRWRLVYYIKSLSDEFNGSNPALLKVVGKPEPMTAGSVRQGYKVYREFKCWECHGGGGEGDGKKAPDLVDDWDFRLPPQNLTMLSAFKNGQRPVDIYRSIMGGLDGGAMPSYADFLEGEERKAWHLVNYIRSLSRERR